jgi:hypothetical protein
MEQIEISGIGVYDNTKPLEEQTAEVQAYIHELMQQPCVIDSCDVCAVVNGSPVERPTQICYDDESKGLRFLTKYTYIYSAQSAASFALESTTFKLEPITQPH